MLLHTTILSCLLLVLATPVRRQVPSGFQIQLKGEEDKCITPTLDGEGKPTGALNFLGCKEAKSWRFTDADGKILVEERKGFFESTGLTEVQVIDGRDVDNYSPITSFRAKNSSEVMQKWHLGQDSRLSLPKQKDPEREELCLTADELVIKTMGCLRGDKAKKSSLIQEWKFK